MGLEHNTLPDHIRQPQAKNGFTLQDFMQASQPK